MYDPNSLALNLSQLRERMAQACRRAQRDPASVRILAVSKFQPIEAIRAAVALGLRDFGENRVQEALEKLPQLPAGAQLHLIGQLQANKVNKAVGVFRSIQSVDRPELAQRLAARAAALGTVQDVLIQVNLTAEAQKGGARPEATEALWELVAQRPELRALGLMALGREGAAEAECRRDFARLRRLAEGLGRQLELSMGMSDDFEWAILEGATQIRIGSLLFGARPAPTN